MSDKIDRRSQLKTGDRASADSTRLEFAINVVRRLQGKGHTAYFAGGCVRDQLMGRTPKDYDVATNALPEQIRSIFGHRRTLSIGAAFGVITVLGPKRAGQIEVATFREDARYSDGRHPDSVTFSSPEEDAKRRDFTINGLFYDPITRKIIDFVHGRTDIQQRVVRAIGDPLQRFQEDKLRMLRAVRFCADLDFELDSATAEAIRRMARELHVVSAERISAEMERMLVHSRRTKAMQLLADTHLLPSVLPEVAGAVRSASDDGDKQWSRALIVLEGLRAPDYALAVAATLFPWVDTTAAETICRRWRLSSEQRKKTVWLIGHSQTLWKAQSMPWPKLQRLLIHPYADDLIKLHEAQAAQFDESLEAIEYCRERLAWPLWKLNPPPLISGNDLIELGLSPGKEYGLILEKVRDAQLSDLVTTKDEAISFAQRIIQAD